MSAVVLFATGCDGNKTPETPDDGTVAVTGISLNKETMFLLVGRNQTLTATVVPENATNKKVTWSSNKPAVASVDATTGEVTAKADGTAIITAATEDGGKTASCTVTVGSPATVATVSLEFFVSETGWVDQRSQIYGVAGTRADIDDYYGTGKFEEGDVFGLFYKVGASGTWENIAYTLGETDLYWEEISKTEQVTFVACYPYTAGITDPSAYVFNAATAANPDLLISAPVTAGREEDADINLIFSHVMCRLLVNLKKDISTPGSLSDVKVTLPGMKPSAKVNLLTGVVDASAASGNDPYPEKTGVSIFYVAPQDLTPGADWVKLELAGNTYIYEVPASLKPDGETQNLTRLEPGKNVNLVLTMKVVEDGKVAVESEITGWKDQGSTISGEIKPQ